MLARDSALTATHDTRHALWTPSRRAAQVPVSRSIKLRRGREVVASLCEEPSKGGLLLAAFAADFDSRADARRHSAAQIGLLDAEHDRLEVRDVDSPLGRAVLAWLLLRCVGLETTGVKELTAGMWC